jgi:hypothetical protein
VADHSFCAPRNRLVNLSRRRKIPCRGRDTASRKGERTAVGLSLVRDPVLESESHESPQVSR